MKYLLALILSVVPTTLYAQVTWEQVQVQVQPGNRVPNYTGVQCVWSSLSCLARHHNITPAKNLIDAHKTPATPADVKAALNPLGILWYQSTTRDTQLLKDACEKGYGAAIGWGGTHMVTCVHFKAGYVVLIDNSDPKLEMRIYTEAQFLQKWDGWAVVLIPLMPRE